MIQLNGWQSQSKKWLISEHKMNIINIVTLGWGYLSQPCHPYFTVLRASDFYVSLITRQHAHVNCTYNTTYS